MSPLHSRARSDLSAGHKDIGYLAAQKQMETLMGAGELTEEEEGDMAGDE
jgi:hypothetical protein